MLLQLSRRQMLRSGLMSAAALPFSGVALAQTWPSKPIKIVVSYPPGGLTDLFARAYGDYISQKVGQPVVVENKPGAGGSIGAQAVKTAPPDGYTLMFTITTTMVMNRVLYKALPYDADKELVLISSMSSGRLPFVAAKATGASNLKEFAEYARKNKMSVGTYAAGSLRPYHRCRTQQALRPADGSRALPRRGAHVAGPVGGRHSGRQRQLRSCLQRAAVRGG